MRLGYSDKEKYINALKESCCSMSLSKAERRDVYICDAQRNLEELCFVEILFQEEDRTKPAYIELIHAAGSYGREERTDHVTGRTNVRFPQKSLETDDYQFSFVDPHVPMGGLWKVQKFDGDFRAKGFRRWEHKPKVYATGYIGEERRRDARVLVERVKEKLSQEMKSAAVNEQDTYKRIIEALGLIKM